MTLNGDNLNSVIDVARKASRATGETYFVVRELDYTGWYHAVNDQTLNTFYVGTSDNNIMYCTADRENT